MKITIEIEDRAFENLSDKCEAAITSPLEVIRLSLPEANWSDLAAEIAKNNRKAAKIGADPMILTMTGTEEIWNEEKQRFFRFAIGTLEGQAPRINGWNFIAAIDHTPAGNIIRRLDKTAEIPEDWKTRPSNCDHCQNQRKRNTTFFMGNAEGQIKQIGTSCLKDFMGFNATPEALIRFAEFGHAIDPHEYQAPRAYEEGLEPLKMFAQNAIAIIRAKGFYRSQTKADEKGTQSTRWMIVENLNLLRGSKEDRERAIRPSEENEREALALIQWGQNQSGDELHQNIKTICSMLGMHPKHLGLLACAAWMFMKENGTAPNYEPKIRPEANSQWLGQPKDKITKLQATCTMLREIESDWGISLLIKMLDTDGNSISWFCSGNRPDCKEGDKIMIERATIKAQSEYKGIKETQITRAKITPLDTPPALG
jgi:hypothetical protein